MTPRRRSTDLLDTDEQKAIDEAVNHAVDVAVAKEMSVDEKIRIHKEECGKPLMADMKVVNDFRVEMNVHMRQLKWLLTAAIVAMLANGGLGRILSAIRAPSIIPGAHAASSVDAAP